ncbi:hypothetical protein P8452_31994 [Trifolium repens]|nr:hypothetical protein P8452_31994 [Trifolium repens]
MKIPYSLTRNSVGMVRANGDCNNNNNGDGNDNFDGDNEDNDNNYIVVATHVHQFSPNPIHTFSPLARGTLNSVTLSLPLLPPHHRPSLLPLKPPLKEHHRPLSLARTEDTFVERFYDENIRQQLISSA